MQGTYGLVSIRCLYSQPMWHVVLVLGDPHAMHYLGDKTIKIYQYDEIQIAKYKRDFFKCKFVRFMKMM